MTYSLPRLACYAILALTLTACATAPKPSHVVIVDPDNAATATVRALSVSELANSTTPVNVEAYSATAVTTHSTLLAPSRDAGVSSPLEIVCYEPNGTGNWNELRNAGGLTQLDAGMTVRIVPRPVPLDSVPFVQAMTDDGYIGEICTHDLQIQ